MSMELPDNNVLINCKFDMAVDNQGEIPESGSEPKKRP